jgi:SAM-dependent methyltransferase
MLRPVPNPSDEGSIFPSAYGHVRVSTKLPPELRQLHPEGMRILYIESGVHSGSSLDTPEVSNAPYVLAVRAFEKIVPHPRRALVLGGGAFHIPRDILQRHPQSVVDVVEIDPAVIEAARSEFALRDDPRLHIYIDDARAAIHRLEPGYDVIIIDVYGNSGVPWHTTTREAISELEAVLAPGGVVVANVKFVRSARDGSTAQRFERNVLATWQSVFGWIRLVDLGANMRGRPQTMLIFLGKGTAPTGASSLASAVDAELRPTYPTYRATEVEVASAGGVVYTDDRGPADYDWQDMYAEEKRAARQQH